MFLVHFLFCNLSIYLLHRVLQERKKSDCLRALFSVTRAATTAGCLDQFEAPEEVDEAKLKCLQQWTEKRLDAVVITVPGKDRDLYRLLCEPKLLRTPVFIPRTDESQLIKAKH